MTVADVAHHVLNVSVRTIHTIKKEIGFTRVQCQAGHVTSDRPDLLVQKK
jgi:hypothetical protein